MALDPELVADCPYGPEGLHAERTLVYEGDQTALWMKIPGR